MKLLKVLVVTLVMAAMVTPVIAEDRLSLSGEMRVRGWHTDYDFDGDTDDSTETWADQRLRIGGKIAVAEGVSITFRTDITESDWGRPGFGSGRSGAAQQWDRAHIDLTKGNFHIRVGQQYVAYGLTYAIDSQDNGIAVDYKFGNVPFNAFVLMDDNNEVDGQHNGDLAAEADAFLYGAKVAPQLGSVGTQFFVGGFNDGGDVDVYLVGANMSADLGGLKLAGEIDFFDGEVSPTVDAFGAQVLLDASMAASDALTVGAQFLYATGDDQDVQVTSLGNGFGGWDPIFDVGTSLSNEQITLGSPFDFSGASAGVIGGRLYSSVKLGAATLSGSAAYLETEEDEFADADVVALAAGLVYPVMENTSFQVQLQYSDGEFNDSDFDAFEAGTGLFVKF